MQTHSALSSADGARTTSPRQEAELHFPGFSRVRYQYTMAAPIRVSQEAFDEVVRENMEEFDMPEEEAVADAVAQFKMQGVDLSNIVRSTVAERAAHPVRAGCPAAHVRSD